MTDIEVNLFYSSNNEITIEDIIDRLIKEKEKIITEDIKNDSITRYNGIKDYLSTEKEKKEVDKK